MASSRRIPQSDHQRPHIDVPMTVFGDPFFRDYARAGRFVHQWCHAVWKNDPAYLPSPQDDDAIDDGIHLGWIVRDPDSLLRLTGPNKNPRWLIGVRREWSTYAIKAVGQDTVKIGRTLDVRRRLEELQVASPHKLELIGTMVGDHERRIHRELRDRSLHVSGEWFRLTDDTNETLRVAGLIQRST